MSSSTDSGRDARGETELERLDRNTAELLNELRVAGAGVQVMFAFPLIVPFNARWSRVGSFDRTEYYVTRACAASAAALLIAPSVHYRILFRAGEKPYLVKIGNRCAIAGLAFLGIGLTGILVLLTHVLFGGAAATIAGGITGAAVAALWFALPLRRRALSGG